MMCTNLAYRAVVLLSALYINQANTAPPSQLLEGPGINNQQLPALTDQGSDSLCNKTWALINVASRRIQAAGQDAHETLRHNLIVLFQMGDTSSLLRVWRVTNAVSISTICLHTSLLISGGLCFAWLMSDIYQRCCLFPYARKAIYRVSELGTKFELINPDRLKIVFGVAVFTVFTLLSYCPNHPISGPIMEYICPGIKLEPAWLYQMHCTTISAMILAPVAVWTDAVYRSVQLTVYVYERLGIIRQQPPMTPTPSEASTSAPPSEAPDLSEIDN
jgi:hypothetical protein